MKKGIHPENYRLVVFKDFSCDKAFLARSCAPTKDTITWEDGKEYPLIKVEVSSASHPFYTGKKIFVDTAGRVEKFNQKYKAKQSAKPAAENKSVQEEPAKPASAEEVAPEVNDTPAVEKAKEETPKAEEVKTEESSDEEAKEEAPAEEEVKEETPMAENKEDEGDKEKEN